MLSIKHVVPQMIKICKNYKYLTKKLHNENLVVAEPDLNL